MADKPRGGWAGRIPPRARQWWTASGVRHWRPALPALMALLGLAVLTLGPAAVAATWYDRVQDREQERITRHYLGAPVRDGSVTFVVHEVRCGASEEAAQGGRCEVTVGVRNNGDQDVTVPGPAQRLRTGEGARHQPTDRDPTPFGTLAPGEATTTVLTYDLPDEVTVTHLEAHADTYSRGQPIDVTGALLPLPD